MATDPCGFRFEPGDVPEQGILPAIDEDWICPRNAVDGCDRCLFHLDPETRVKNGVDHADLVDALIAEIRESDAAVKLLGAKFGDLDLSYRTLESRGSHPIDLRGARIEGDFRASHAFVRQPLLLDGVEVTGSTDLSKATFHERVQCRFVTFDGDVTMRDARFQGDLTLESTTFAGSIDCRRVTFEGNTDAYGVTFVDSADFRSATWGGDIGFHRATFCRATTFLYAEFRGETDFRKATFRRLARFSRATFDRAVWWKDVAFERDALFKKVDFGGPAYYQCATFGGEASFSEATFDGAAKFRSAIFEGEASISYVAFRDNAFFPDATFEAYASFYETEFHHDADFRDTQFSYVDHDEHDVRYKNGRFGKRTYFDRARFDGEVDFRSVDFGDRTSFVETVFGTAVTMRAATFEDGRLVDVIHEGEEPVVDLRDATIAAGRVTQNGQSPVYYDLQDGVLGDVAIDLHGQTVFDRLRLFRTEFDGFDFARHREELSPDWILHYVDSDAATNVAAERSYPQVRSRLYDLPVVGGLLDRIDEPHAADIETTYLKAKNGATDAGDHKSASKFFIREMQFRRRLHRQRTLDAAADPTDRVRWVGSWFLNVFFTLSCGYGEKPHRTLLFSAALVGAYALLFAWVLPTSPYGDASGYLVLSIESFTTLVLAGGANVSDASARLLADTEGFFGAFLIALFVFALTRSVHR